MDVERIMALFGPKMYDAKLSKVLVKESAQNSYDALKDLFEIDPTVKPEIEYGVWEYGSSEIDKKRAWNWGQTIKEKKYGEVAVPEELIEDTIKSLEKGDAFADSQWFYVRDNGIGMNPEIINNAFLLWEEVTNNPKNHQEVLVLLRFKCSTQQRKFLLKQLGTEFRQLFV